MIFWVTIKENTVITRDITDAIQITNWEALGDNFDKESPSISSCNICPVYPTEAIESSISNSDSVRLGKKFRTMSPALIFIINQGNTIWEIPKKIWLIITSDLKRQ
jgi:hypothetical protein